MEMSMNMETFRGIMGKYRSIILSADDVEEVFHMVHDIFEAEVDAMRINEPYATRTIKRYEDAMAEINYLAYSASEAFERM